MLAGSETLIRRLLLSNFYRALCVNRKAFFDVKEVITVQGPRRCYLDPLSQHLLGLWFHKGPLPGLTCGIECPVMAQVRLVAEFS